MVFGIKKLFNKILKVKMSELILNVAGDFINMGEDINEKQEYLNCAVSSWNIACLKKENQKAAINKYIKEYRKLNPTFSIKDFKDEEENIKLIIQQKDKLYPNINKQIAGAKIQEINGKIHVTVASIRIK